MKELIAGVVLIALVIIISLILGRNVEPDLSGDGGYEPCIQSGHPLYQDC